MIHLISNAIKSLPISVHHYQETHSDVNSWVHYSSRTLTLDEWNPYD